MFRLFLLISSITLNAAILLEGDPCKSDKVPVADSGAESFEGVCTPVSKCSSNWFYGTRDHPVCGDPDSDYKDPATLVCCFSSEDKKVSV